MWRRVIASAALVMTSGFAQAEVVTPRFTSVVVPDVGYGADAGPILITVGRAELVKIEVDAMAGSRITFDLRGPARLAGAYQITRKSGDFPAIGADSREYWLAATGAGTVVAKVTKQAPIPGTPSDEIVYQITVK